MNPTAKPDPACAVLRAGSAVADITPPVGLELAGGAFGPATGVLHPLKAKGLWIERDTTGLLLIVCDLLGMDWDYGWAIRRAIAEATGIGCDAIMLACTHTHGGPATMRVRNWGAPDPSYTAKLQRTLVELAVQARAQARPARIGAGHIACPGVAVNRCFGQQGPVDDCLAVMRVDDAEGRPLAVIVNYACHAVNLHSAGMVTPDFPHHLEQGVQHGLQSAAPVMFLSGAGGDLNPANFRARTPSEPAAIQTAGKLARKTLELWPAIATAPDASLAFATRTAGLPLQPLPAPEELRRAIATARQALDQLADRSPTNWDYARHNTMIGWAEEALAIVEAGRAETARRIVLQAFCAGETAIVGIPGELFTEFGIAMRAAGIVPRLLIATQANGAYGYFPSRPAFATNSYEAAHSPRYLGAYYYQPAVGEIVCEQAIALLRQLAPR
jgi:neutral ceramidase